MRRVAIGTGGGDATGLNAVIRSAVLTGRVKLVPLDGDTICTARELGLSLGD